MSTPTRKNQGFIGHRRDAYELAVKDNILETDYNMMRPNNTYHGVQTKHRSSVNFYDVPMRFTETFQPRSLSNEGRSSYTSDSLTTPSTTGSVSPFHNKSQNCTYEELALISLSPSTDKAFMQTQRQLSQSDTSSSVFETPDTPVQTPRSTQRVKFDENMQPSPGGYTSSSYSLSQHRSPSIAFSYDYRIDEEYSLPAPPTVRRQSSHDTQYNQAIPERPVTLDIIPRPRPTAGRKKNSPVHIPTRRSRTTPTPSDASMTGDDMSYQSARSTTSPGSTPPKIAHQTTLLDIDMEGQKRDTTRPLPCVIQRSLSSNPPMTALEDGNYYY